MTEDQDGVRRQEIASRVIYWMNRRGFTRKLFADRLGKSVSWVDKIKSGDRQLDRLSVLEHIADVLDIELRVLLDAEQAVQTEQCADEVEITALQEALQRYEGICGTAQLDEDPNLDDLRRTLHYCWTAFQASSYQAVTRLLPDFLVALQQAYRGATEPSARERAADYLTQAYWLAAEIAFKLGRIDLGWLAADRGIAVAEWTGDPALIGATARRLVHALMAASDRDSGRRSVALVTAIAARLANAARLLGGDRNEHYSAFGPTNVMVHRVSALADMREGGRVVEEARSISSAQLATLPRERRANHLLDVARGFHQWGKHDEAVRLVLDADNLAREEVRCRPITHQLVFDLARTYPRGTRPTAPLARIAREIGIQI